MSHEITVRDDGKAEMAFTGPRTAIWHGLGQELQVDATIEQWITAAGMDFEVFESMVKFNDFSGQDHIYPARKALFRSDTLAPLSIVGEDFNIVQPGDVMEFFRDLVKTNDMKLSTAGTLFGGKRFWALAEMGQECNIVKGDTVKQHLLLTTAVDGSMATAAKVVATRVVCNNTLTLAMSEKSNTLARVTHKKVLDADQLKLDLGLIDKQWITMMDNLRALANVKMDAKKTMRFFEDLYYDPKKTAEKQSLSTLRMVAKISELAFSGSGSDLSKGTAWGALNGATEYFTHGTGRRDQSSQFWESYHGTLAAQKTAVYRALVAA